MNRKDLTNQRFGRLIALRPTAERHGSCIVWECQCDCGRKAMAPTNLLINGNIRSCGCLQRENRYKDASGRRIGKLTALEPVPGLFYGGEPIWRWRCDCGRIVRKTLGQVGNSASTMCPFCRQELNRSQAEHMRKLQNRDPVSGISPGMLESMMEGKLHRNNSSGVRGVCWHRRLGKWQARVFSHGKCVWSEYFSDLQQAKEARERVLADKYGDKNDQKE